MVWDTNCSNTLLWVLSNSLGVYFAKDGQVSMGNYVEPSNFNWGKTELHAISCAAIAEIVNLPAEFVSNNPYFVVNDTDWISWLVIIHTSRYSMSDAFYQSIPDCSVSTFRWQCSQPHGRTNYSRWHSEREARSGSSPDFQRQEHCYTWPKLQASAVARCSTKGIWGKSKDEYGGSRYL